MIRKDKPQFVWKKPSSKQEDILYWWTPASPHKDKSYAVFEGAVRSAKTMSSSYSFINWASFNYDGEDFALTAKTIGTCIRNVIRPLRKMMSIEPCYEINEHRSSIEGHNLVITNNEIGNTNTFYIYGGKDESSQDLIQGKTLAGIFFDEAPLMPLSFINQGLARLSVEGAKAWFTLNPETPRHPFYVSFLDPLQNTGKVFYLHLNMDDNPDMSDEARNRLKTQWPIGSVWYRRYVLGQRASAEGSIYNFFSDRTEDGYIIDELPKDLTSWLVAADYGQQHPTCFGLAGFSQGLNKWILVKEFYTENKTNAIYSKEFKEQILDYNNGIFPLEIAIDPGGGGAALITQFNEDYPDLIVNAATKKNVGKEIQDLATSLYLKKFVIYKGCTRVITEMQNYLWNEKAKERGIDEPLKKDDDGPDMMRYLNNMIKRYS